MDLMRSFTKILLLKRKKKRTAKKKNAKSVCICVINTISVITKKAENKYKTSVKKT